MPGQQPFLDRLDQYRDVARVGTAVREAAADEPQAFLRRALPHVAHLAFGIEAPYRPDLLRDIFADQVLAEHLLPDEPRREHDEIRRLDGAVLHERAVLDEALDVLELHQPDFAVDDELRAARVEVIAAVARAHLPLVPRAVFA